MDQHERLQGPGGGRTWTVAEASRRFDEVLRLAREDGPQVIVGDDGAAFTIASGAAERGRPGSLRDLLVNSPLRDLDFEFEGMRGPVRDVDLR